MNNKSFKLLFVMTQALHPNNGGVQMTTCKLGRHFISLGHHVAVYSFARQGHSEEEPMALIHAQHDGGHGEPQNLVQLEETLQRIQPDIVINQMPYEHAIGDVLKANKAYQQASRSGLERIHFHGRQVPDEYYRGAAIFFMTSAFEGFSNTLVEAQSHAAIPVVFDSYPFASWIVEEGRSGHLIKPFDVAAMASRIVAVAESPERDALDSQVLESVRRFQVDQVGQQWQALFEAEVSKHVATAGPAQEVS